MTAARPGRRLAGTRECTGPNRKKPAERSSSVANTLAESARGRHIHSTAPSGAISAVVAQSDRNAYSAMGGYGERADACVGSAGTVTVTAGAFPQRNALTSPVPDEQAV